MSLRNRTRSAAFALACAALMFTIAPAPAGAQTDAQAPAEMTPPKPGPEHARLANQAGKWKISQKSMWDPSKPPVTGEGTEECTLVCNGLFLRSDYHVKDVNGDFWGTGLLGYDVEKQKYVGTWADSYSTAQFQYEGTCDGNTCTFTMPIPAMGGRPAIVMTMIAEDVDQDHRKFTITSTGPDGKAMTMMESTYTRK